MTSISFCEDEKRRLQITLAKNISPEARYELLATALDGRDIYDVYNFCPKCEITSGVKVIHSEPQDEETIEAISNGEIKSARSFTHMAINKDHNVVCLNCLHTWFDDTVSISIPGAYDPLA